MFSTVVPLKWVDHNMRQFISSGSLCFDCKLPLLIYKTRPS